MIFNKLNATLNLKLKDALVDNAVMTMSKAHAYLAKKALAFMKANAFHWYQTANTNLRKTVLFAKIIINLFLY